jgi:hypothetical protein
MKRLSTTFAALALFLSAGIAAEAAAPIAQPTRAPVAVLKACSSGYVHAIIGGAHKCLRSGQFCAKSYTAQYRRYGFVCKPGSDGRYRLHRR